MPQVRTYSLDTLQKIRKELKKQAQPKRTRELSTKEAIAELRDLLTDKLAAGWTLRDLAASLSAAGLPIAPKTLQEYLELGQKSSPAAGSNPAPREVAAAEPPADQPGTEAPPAGFVVMQEDEL
jgi:hypothetical protein